MTSMRRDILDHALEIDYLDAGLVIGPNGPRIVMRPHSKSGIAMATMALDVQAARMLSLHLQQFVREVEAGAAS